MGRDKALIEIDGVPMVTRVVQAAEAAGAAEVWVIGRTALPGPVPGPGAARLLEDDVPGAGPLGGILTALRHATHDVTLVVACDLLEPSPEAFRRTVAAGGDVAVPLVAGREQWHHAAWHRRTADHLQERFDAGERAVRRAVEGLAVTRIPDLGPRAVADADTPDDVLNAGTGRGTSLPSDEHPRDHGP
jgi:molybdopterin-guanine dinucleotide biosynthesis protein A